MIKLVFIVGVKSEFLLVEEWAQIASMNESLWNHARQPIGKNTKSSKTKVRTAVAKNPSRF